MQPDSDTGFKGFRESPLHDLLWMAARIHVLCRVVHSGGLNRLQLGGALRMFSPCAGETGFVTPQLKYHGSLGMWIDEHRAPPPASVIGASPSMSSVVH